MKKILTIAGSDCSGGAGIQADIKTITAHRMYAMSVITALTAQNTTGVYGVSETSAEFVGLQMDCVFSDIRPDAVKIGMVSSSQIIEIIASKLKESSAENIVVDPVMVSTSGSRLINNDAVKVLVNQLLPIATLITPNIPEAEVLCGFDISDENDMIRAAKKIAEKIDVAILIKGGHLIDKATDLLYVNGEITWFSAPHIDTPNTHGTGCTLSSAITCNLANGMSLGKSVEESKKYLNGALQSGLNLGRGSGPLNHVWNI